ncbi:flagellar biosynthesis protein FlhB [Caproiciproducens sp. LBM24188]|nr:flagellar biosynthesis protein FlhB [Oscillospiraceae bacterium]HHV31936.1 flagellar biosynthesis protein FlhB [Clostridiales bacterium]
MADSSKTEKATPKKKEDARKKGNIFQSADVVSALSILTLFFTLKLVFPFIYQYMSGFLRKYFVYTKTVDVLSTDFVMDLFRDCTIAFLLMAGPVMLASIVAGVVGTGVQTRFKISKENLKFKFSRLSPIQGIKRLISLRSVIEVVKSLIKIIVMAAMLYTSGKEILNDVAKLMYEDVAQAVYYILNSIMNIVIKLSVVFVAIAALDYLYQWWEYERSLRMTKQEVKDEYKQMEGDPQIKGQIRERQRRMANQRMMQQVPTADVIVRNPTHFAIALRYDIEKDSAPVVVAKGQDYVALKIIEIAEQNHIPMTENRPLARALYREVEVNAVIPPQYYVVLAEIMAWVYSMKRSQGDFETSK